MGTCLCSGRWSRTRAWRTPPRCPQTYARGNEISAERCRALWDTVRKTMANKLFDAVKAQVAGVLASGTLMSLPTEVKRRVAEKLDAYGLATLLHV